MAVVAGRSTRSLEVMQKKRAIAAILVAIGVLSSNEASACSCATPESWWDSKAPVIFHARILAAELTPETKNGIPVVSVRYQLVERFRGDPTTIRELRTITDTGMCGVYIMPGYDWIVHTTPEGWLWLCSGSRSILPTLDGDKVVLEKLRQARDKK